MNLFPDVAEKVTEVHVWKKGQWLHGSHHSSHCCSSRSSLSSLNPSNFRFLCLSVFLSSFFSSIFLSSLFPLKTNKLKSENTRRFRNTRGTAIYLEFILLYITFYSHIQTLHSEWVNHCDVLYIATRDQRGGARTLCSLLLP